MFELTDTLTYAVPVMFSVLVAKTVADALEPKGIYDLVIELNQLPYLDSKHEYLWQNLQINDAVCVYYYVTSYHLLIYRQIQRDVPVIHVDQKNTVYSLKAQLLSLTSSGADDNGFPILQRGGDDNGTRLLGYIGSNELDHALSTYRLPNHSTLTRLFTGLVPPDVDEEVHFHTAFAHHWASSSVTSLQESVQPLPQSDPFDFTPYMDQVSWNDCFADSGH